MRHIALILFIISGLTASAQVDSVYVGVPDTTKQVKQKKEHPGWDAIKNKLTYGANFQAWIGNPTFVYLAPTVGFLLTPKLNVGIGVVYNYTRADYGAYGSYSQSLYGGHSYLRYIITDGIFAQVQYDKLRQPDFLSVQADAKTWVDYVLVGGGFRQPLGERAAFMTAIMYNLSPSILSIYYPNRVVIQFGIVGTF